MRPWVRRTVKFLVGLALVNSLVMATMPMALAKSSSTHYILLRHKNSRFLRYRARHRRPVVLRGPIWNPYLAGTRTQLVYERVGKYVGTLYLFRPSRLRKGVRLSPVVVYFHGGALVKGSAVIQNVNVSPRDWILSHVETYVVDHGGAFVSVNYRLAPRYKWPAQIDDAKTAIRFLRAKADSFHLNPRDFAVMGDSAGGALASLVGLSNTSDFNRGPWAHESSSVSSVVDMFGPVDRRYLEETWRLRYGLLPNPVFGNLTPRLVHSASAVSYVHRGAPPFLIIQGTQDTVVPPWLSTELYRLLQRRSDEARLVLVHHSEHEFMPVGAPISPTKAAIAADIESFLMRTPKHRLPHYSA